MTKRLTIAVISLLALAMLVATPVVATANQVVVDNTTTLFRGEQGLNISATGVENTHTILWFQAGANPAIDAASATYYVSNVASFFVDPTMQVGAWYRPNRTQAFIVADPAIDVQLRSVNLAGQVGTTNLNDKTVIKGDNLTFRITSNLDAMVGQRNSSTTGLPSPGAPVRVRVTGPNGNVFTSLYNSTGTLVDLDRTGDTTINENPFTVSSGVTNDVWATGHAAYARGTYTFRVDCNVNSMNGNYDVTGKTVSRTYSVTIADDDLIITSNKDTVVRNNDFAITIDGRPSTDYVLWVKGTSNIPSAEVPAIKAGQQGVFLNDTPAGVTAGQYIWSTGNTVRGDVPFVGVAPVGVAPIVNPFYAMVRTDASGKRTVGFATNQSTRDQSFTIRVQENVALAAGPDYDEVRVRVEQGDVTITASGDRSYYIGEEVTLSGVNTDSNNVWLFITGPNLGATGASLLNPSEDVRTAAGGWNSRIQPVRGDDTWEYKWNTANLALDAGTYTIYAVAAERDRGQLGQTPTPKYATVSVVIRKGFVSATASQAAVAKGDSLFIRGNAEGNPSPGVAIWVLGRNYYDRTPQTVEDDATYEYELTSAMTKNMASGQYFVVVQHPMGNNRFDVVDHRIPAAPGVPFVRYVQMAGGMVAGTAPDVGTNAFVVEGENRLQGSDAAEALIQLLNNPNIDDTYIRLTFLVEEPWIRIDSVSDKFVGSTFTITGTTNLGVDNDLLVEVTSSAFEPTDKTVSAEFSGASETVRVVQGDAGYNTWSFEVDATTFIPDEYIVTVESIMADASTTTTFNVLEGAPVTEPPVTTPPVTTPPVTTPPATQPPEPPETPGFGALIAIAGLGAVAFLVLRRN